MTVLALSHRFSAQGVAAAALALALACSALTPTAQAQEGNNEQTETLAEAAPLRVAVKPAEPFVRKTSDGRWSGLSVELWQAVDGQLGLPYEFVEVDSTQALFAGLQDGSFDVGVGALSVTGERERLIDFTQPYYNAGVGIAVNGETGGWAHGLRQLFSWEFLSAVLVLSAVLLIVGFLMWMVEHRSNPEQFGGKRSQGIGNGFWWSAVTMTTVGYGDKAPITTAGRALALVWMFASIITISGFTAAIASAVTIGQLSGAVQTVDDLPAARVGTVPNTSSAEFLTFRGIKHRKFDTVDAALDALAAGTIDAVVYDRPILRALLLNRDDDSRVLNILARPEDYAFALPQGSPLREQLNPLMLEYVQTEAWVGLRQQYVGR